MSYNDERESVKKKYDSIRAACGLPEMQDFELEFGRIVDEPVVSTILVMIADGLGRHLSHIESIFTPTRISDNIEAEFYEGKDVALLYKAYKEMICTYHDINIGFLKSEKEMLKNFFYISVNFDRPTFDIENKKIYCSKYGTSLYEKKSNIVETFNKKGELIYAGEFLFDFHLRE